MDRIVILGASRGFGRALSLQISIDYPKGMQLLLSRQQPAPGIQVDLSKSEGQERSWREILNFRPSHILYVAGGGPFGNFYAKPLHSHEWTLEVNFLSPGL